MQQFTYSIKDPLGIHARPAGLLVKEVQGYGSKVEIIKDERIVDASKIMAVMSLGIKCGHTITLQIQGTDEEEEKLEAKKLQDFFEKTL